MHWVLGELSPGLEWPECEADFSPPTSAEVKNSWIHTSTPPLRLLCVVLNQLSTDTAWPLPYGYAKR
jgi:hypothetical protein